MTADRLRGGWMEGDMAQGKKRDGYAHIPRRHAGGSPVGAIHLETTVRHGLHEKPPV